MENRVKKNKKFGNTILVVGSLGVLSLVQKYTGWSYSLLSLGAIGLISTPSIPMVKRMSEEMNEFNVQRKLVLKMDQNENKED